MAERRHGDRGSAAIEMALIAPALVFLLMLLVLAGRVAGATGDVQAAARDGARAASLVRGGSPTQVGTDAVRAALDQRGVRCVGFDARVTVSGGYARAEVDCFIDMNLLGPLGIPDRKVSATAVEVIDVYRGQ